MSDDRKDETTAADIAWQFAGGHADVDEIERAIMAYGNDWARAARSAALEEAARVADIEASTDKYATDSQAHRIAAAIRELKDK